MSSAGSLSLRCPSLAPSDASVNSDDVTLSRRVRPNSKTKLGASASKTNKQSVPATSPSTQQRSNTDMRKVKVRSRSAISNCSSDAGSLGSSVQGVAARRRRSQRVSMASRDRLSVHQSCDDDGASVSTNRRRVSTISSVSGASRASADTRRRLAATETSDDVSLPLIRRRVSTMSSVSGVSGVSNSSRRRQRGVTDKGLRLPSVHIHEATKVRVMNGMS